MMRTLEPNECERLLKSRYHGHLACTADGKPYLVPVSYVWTPKGIVGYTHEGKKIDMMRANPHVCLQVEDITDRAWRSVVVYGTYNELSGTEKTTAIDALGQFVANAKISPPFVREDMIAAVHPPAPAKHPVIYRIEIDEVTGRAFGELSDLS